MSRPPINGRFHTREELEDRVRHLWRGGNSIELIARVCKVSPPVVRDILKLDKVKEKT